MPFFLPYLYFIHSFVIFLIISCFFYFLFFLILVFVVSHSFLLYLLFLCFFYCVFIHISLLFSFSFPLSFLYFFSFFYYSSLLLRSIIMRVSFLFSLRHQYLMWQTRVDALRNAGSSSKTDQHLPLKNISESITDRYTMSNFMYNSKQLLVPLIMFPLHQR